MPSCIHWDGYYEKEGRKRMKIARIWWEYGKIGTHGTAAENVDGATEQYGGPSKS